MPGPEPPPVRRTPAARRSDAAARRLVGLQAALLAAAALTLGLTPGQLAARQRTKPVQRIAQERGVDVARLQAVALTAAEPLLDEAVRSGALSRAERDRLAWSIRAHITSV
jgi:hypothetical protein